MREKYDLNELLKEIKEERGIDLRAPKNTRVSQQGIKEMFAQNKKDDSDSLANDALNSNAPCKNTLADLKEETGDTDAE
ncbi:MAG: hypothetical protein D6B28_10955 [Gammaproteobacteria bacterium]|nr:MAG: hypothetical protein D6B28_10955 [Gammaproteobacteria bacterium]